MRVVSTCSLPGPCVLQDVDTYVHRIGRTGRAGASGEALTLLSNEDGGVAKGIVSVRQAAA